VPGIPPWNQIVRLPALWHFNFGARTPEPPVAGRERIYLDRFWNESPATRRDRRSDRRHYAAIYARPGAMHSAFAQFLAIGQKDEADNLKAMETKLAMPVLRHRAREGLRRQRGGRHAQRSDERPGKSSCRTPATG